MEHTKGCERAVGVSSEVSGRANDPVPPAATVQALTLRWLGTRSVESLRPDMNRGLTLGQGARYVNSFTRKLLMHQCGRECTKRGKWHESGPGTGIDT